MKAHRIILVGPGGSGKDHLAKQLVERGYKKAVSCTTRPPRKGEVDGVDYHFIEEPEFRKLIDGGKFREWYSFGADNWLYGTLETEFQAAHLFIMSPPVLSTMGPITMSGSIVVFLNIPESVRRQRLSARADADSVDRRLDADNTDFANFDSFDVEVTDPLFDTGEVLQTVLNAERARNQLARHVGRVLAPLASSADRAERDAEQTRRLLHTEMSPDASPGWGIRLKHLTAARDLLGVLN